MEYCSCNCLGTASAAKVPIKRYNILVPDIYPVVEPTFGKPLGIGVEKKIKKLAEYLENNEHRAPKVSRRLARRLARELHRRKYGYVALTVRAYETLLRTSKPENSALYGSELVVRSAVKSRRQWLLGRSVGVDDGTVLNGGQAGSVVGLLLNDRSPEMRKLGVGLLTDFTRVQHTTDYMSQLEGFVPMLCGAMEGGSAPLGRQQQGEQEQQLGPACLRALLEHLRFCSRVSYVSHHLDTVLYAVLGAVERAGISASEIASRFPSARAALEAGVNPLAGIGRESIGGAVGAAPPAIAALLVLEELRNMTQDAAEGKKVLEFMMRYLDQGGRWLGGPALEVAALVMQRGQREEHQQYLLYSSLMRHVHTARLSPAERAAVLRLVLAEGMQLEAALAAPALLLALRELPHALNGLAAAPAAGGAAARVTARPASAGRAGPAAPPAQQQLELASRSAAAGSSVPAAAVTPQQLHEQALAAVRQLAGRVSEGSQLLEVIAATVGRLHGPSPAATEALQCCIAAAGLLEQTYAAQDGTRPRSLPHVLLQELSGVMLEWQPEQRLLAHQLVLLLLPAASEGLKQAQAQAALSLLWHEAGLASNPPAAYVALDAFFGALLEAQPAATLQATLQLAAALTQEVLLGASARLLELTAAQACAMLCLSKSMLRQLASHLRQEGIAQLAAPGCDAALDSLRLVGSGGGLRLVPIAAAAAGSSTSSEGQLEPAAAAAVGFTPAEQISAATYLADWRQHTSAEQHAAQLAAIQAAVPLFKQQGGAPTTEFKPLALGSLLPRMKGAAMGGSSASTNSMQESRWARRLRQASQQQTSVKNGMDGLGAGEAAAAGALLRAEEAGSADAEGDEGGPPRGVDEVLAEVEAALDAAAEQMARGRTPSPELGLSLPSGLERRAGGALAGASPFAAAQQACQLEHLQLRSTVALL